MPVIRVKLPSLAYRIEIETGSLDSVGERAREALGESARRAVVVTNKTVDAIFGARVSRSLKRDGFSVDRITIGDGERFKTLKTANEIYTFLITNRIERADAIIALGGGVVGDVAGFVAATYLRGVRIVHLPTTLLAQIDSSVGGKTAVNHSLGKNLIGAFHQPSLVVIDPESLGTLPPRQLRAGLFEAMKYGVIRDRRLFNRISRRINDVLGNDLAELSHLITRSCAIKAEIVAADERETGLRRILNFGHTVGHALEAVTGYRRFLHGEAVAHGMRAAAAISERIELLSRLDRAAIEDLIRRIGKLPDTNSLALDAIMTAMQHDKKSVRGNLTFVLPKDIGSVVLRPDVQDGVVRSAIREALL